MNICRRSFLRRSLVTAGALSTADLLPVASLLSAPEPGRKLKLALIGCGGRGMNHLEWMVTQTADDVIAIVDPDEKRQGTVKKYMEGKGRNVSALQAFTDYRVMFDKLGKELDAVVIASPNHHHAGPSVLGMNLDKAVFCEKPLCHDVHQARMLREMAAKSKAATQMGNQGHCEDGYIRLCEFVAAGVVGKITETHSWSDRANGGTGPRPKSTPAPGGMIWDSWIGPAPYRDFHADLHPHEWHGWFDFGNGSLGNMGCHVLDGLYWALKLDHPDAIELEETRGGSDERYPVGARIRWDFPSRGEMPPVKVYWYEGFNAEAKVPEGSVRVSAKGKTQNLPPLLLELKKQYPDEPFDTNGTLYVGEKGILYTGTYGGRMRVVPIEKMQTLQQPPRTLPRPKNVFTDFVEAVRSGKKQTAASFDYASRLTEFTLLGNLAQHAGLHKKLVWDGPAMRVKNMPELDRWIKCPVRSGWPA